MIFLTACVGLHSKVAFAIKAIFLKATAMFFFYILKVLYVHVIEAQNKSGITGLYIILTQKL